MAGSRRPLRRIRCFTFRKRRNIFEYVDNPSQVTQADLADPNRDVSNRSSEPSKRDEADSDTTEDLDDIPSNRGNFETHDAHATNLNVPKDKIFRKKSSSRSKMKTPRSSITESPRSNKTPNDVSADANYLGYGMVDLPKEFKKLNVSRGASMSSKLSANYGSLNKGDPIPNRDYVCQGSKMLIGGKLSDGKPSLESRIWDMIERRGWGMMHGSWNMMGPRVFNKVVEFLTGLEISLCRQVSKGWYRNVTDVMVMRSEVIVDAFNKTYKDKLDYDRSYILFQPVLTATKSLRIDVIIRAKVEPFCTLHKNSFGYTYSYQSSVTNGLNGKDSTPSGNESSRSKESGREGFGLFNRRSSRASKSSTTGSNGVSSKKPIFISKFMFEVLRKNSCRTITFTRDLSSMHREDINLATSPSVCQVCEGDYIEVPITLINAIGATDVNCIKFLPMVRDALSHAPSQLDLLHREWYTVEPNSKYLEQLFPQNIHSYSIIHPHKLLPQLVHQLTQVAGIDVITSKSSYVASHLGMVVESRNIIGHTVEVVGKADSVICMIQRIGLQHDRICHVQLRPGDVLQFYLTKG